MINNLQGWLNADPDKVANRRDEWLDAADNDMINWLADERPESKWLDILDKHIRATRDQMSDNIRKLFRSYLGREVTDRDLEKGEVVYMEGEFFPRMIKYDGRVICDIELKEGCKQDSDTLTMYQHLEFIPRPLIR